MPNPKVLIVGLFSLLVYHASAQSRLDSIVQHLRVTPPRATAIYLHEVFNRNDDVADLLINRIAEKASKSSIPEDNLSMAYSYLGEQRVKEKRLKEGYDYLKEAKQLTKMTKAFPLLLFYYKYASTFKIISRYDSALFYGRRMLDLSRELKEDSVEVEALKLVGSLYYDASQYPLAIQSFKYIIQKETADRTQKRNAYHSIALGFRNLARYDSALFYFQPTLEHTAKNDTLYLGLVYGNIGDTYFLQQKYTQALPYLLTELEYTTQKEINSNGLDCMNTLAELYLRINNIKKAQLYYDWLGYYVKSSQATPSVRLNYLRLSSEYFKKKKDFKKSLDFVHQYYQLKDSLAAIHNNELVAEVSAQYDFDQQRKEIEFLHQQTLVQEAKSKQKSFLLAGSLMGLILIGALLFVLFINYRQKKESYDFIKQHSVYVEQVNQELKVNMEKLEEKNKEIGKLAERLQEVNASKDKLFSIISHDLKNPIISLKGLLSMVEADHITQEEFVQFSSKLKAGVGHIDFTMNNLLQWARTQMQGIRTVPARICLVDLVGENLNFLSGNANHKNIELRNEVTRDLHGYADKNQIHLVLRNLVSNAIKFTPEHGKITVSTCPNEGTNSVTVAVVDTGVGMNGEAIHILFTKKDHYTTYGTDGEKGSGLGLLLCREMIENNRGKLWVESTPGKGSAFYFTLPLA
jgi:signal transduction histidine kinase